MLIDQDYINKLADLSNEVLKDESLSPTARILIQTLLSTTQVLFIQLQEARTEINELKERIKILEVQKSKDSHNSNLPPSSDRRRPPPRQKRGPSPNLPGGQPGHPGSTLRATASPDKVIKYKLKGNCSRCGNWLGSITKKMPIKRQVFDLKFEVVVTEHQAEAGTCRCGRTHTASFPHGVNAFVQYGTAVRGLVNYLSTYQLIPFERLEEIFKDIFDLSLCEGTIFNTNKASFDKLHRFEKKAKEALLNSDINHADETPIKVKKENAYLHVLSNEGMTLLYPHSSRGKKAVAHMGVLNNYKGVLSSDFYSLYYSYSAKNAACHAHLARELTLQEEEFKCRWAHELRIFFQDLNHYLDEYRAAGSLLPEHERMLFYDEFRGIIFRGKLETPGWGSSDKKSAAENLLSRLIRHEEAVLRFMNDIRVPFTNNLAERDLRMAKVRQKVSGCFRTFEGARLYARFRSYVSTVKKQGRNVWRSILAVHKLKNPSYIELFT